MVDGSENTGLLSGGGMMKKGGGTGPSSPFPDLRLCGLVDAVADAPRVTEGVVEREEVLRDFDEHWKVLSLLAIGYLSRPKMIPKIN